MLPREGAKGMVGAAIRREYPPGDHALSPLFPQVCIRIWGHQLRGGGLGIQVPLSADLYPAEAPIPSDGASLVTVPPVW